MIESDLKYEYHVLAGFEDSRISPQLWNDLLTGTSDVIFMTWHWQKVWWEVFGRGELLLIVAELEGTPKMIAPLFADEDGMIYLIGSGGSDYLDLIGDLCDSAILKGLLDFINQQIKNISGLIFYHMLEDSPTYRALDLAAKELGWRSNNMGEMISPMLEMKEFPELAHQAARKKSLLRHEGWFVRNGGITVEHLTTSEEISIHLDEFFSQHIARWESTPYPSLFLKSKHQVFYQKLSQLASHTGWFRFTRIIWNERPIAFHFGFNYKGNFFWYKPSFDITLAKNSPGEVLLRQLFLSAQSENSCIFDFGLGDEPFKKRFATKTRKVISWEVYPQ